MVMLKSITAAAACAAIVDAVALLPRANSTKKLVTSVRTSLLIQCSFTAHPLAGSPEAFA